MNNQTETTKSLTAIWRLPIGTKGIFKLKLERHYQDQRELFQLRVNGNIRISQAPTADDVYEFPLNGVQCKLTILVDANSKKRVELEANGLPLEAYIRQDKAQFDRWTTEGDHRTFLITLDRQTLECYVDGVHMASATRQFEWFGTSTTFLINETCIIIDAHGVGDPREVINRLYSSPSKHVKPRGVPLIVIPDKIAIKSTI